MVLFCGQVGEVTTTSEKEITGGGRQLSVAVAMPVLAGAVLVAQEIVMLAGQKIAGPLKSLTVMICKHVALLPHWSVAVQERWMAHCGGVGINTYRSVYVKVLVPPQLLTTVG